MEALNGKRGIQKWSKLYELGNFYDEFIVSVRTLLGIDMRLLIADSGPLHKT